MSQMKDCGESQSTSSLVLLTLGRVEGTILAQSRALDHLIQTLQGSLLLKAHAPSHPLHSASGPTAAPHSPPPPVSPPGQLSWLRRQLRKFGPKVILWLLGKIGLAIFQWLLPMAAAAWGGWLLLLRWLLA